MSTNTNRPRRKLQRRAKSNPERQPFSADVRAVGRIVAALRGLDRHKFSPVRVVRAACQLAQIDPKDIAS